MRMMTNRYLLPIIQLIVCFSWMSSCKLDDNLSLKKRKKQTWCKQSKE
jgi:hypothetical protein